uniref:Uncharacterized protein n=1 Tax=Cannabis sativa TaxID=3483 RepID=A0A803QXX9_CANSA
MITFLNIITTNTVPTIITTTTTEPRLKRRLPTLKAALNGLSSLSNLVSHSRIRATLDHLHHCYI